MKLREWKIKTHFHEEGKTMTRTRLIMTRVRHCHDKGKIHCHEKGK